MTKFIMPKARTSLSLLSVFILSICSPLTVFASSMSGTEYIDLTQHWAGYLAIVIFIVAYITVILEEKIHMRKSKPVMLSAGLIWGIIAWVYNQNGFDSSVEKAIRHNFLEYVELFFLLTCRNDLYQRYGRARRIFCTT